SGRAARPCASASAVGLPPTPMWNEAWKRWYAWRPLPDLPDQECGARPLARARRHLDHDRRGYEVHTLEAQRAHTAVAHNKTIASTSLRALERNRVERKGGMKQVSARGSHFILGSCVADEQLPVTGRYGIGLIDFVAIKGALVLRQLFGRERR